MQSFFLRSLAILGAVCILSNSPAPSAVPGSRTIEIRDHVRLHYLDWGGDKQPLVLLAGLGDTAYIFSQLGPLLTPEFRVLALTRRGFGQSELTRDGYTISDRVEDLRNFLDALKLWQVVLVGHSAAGDELTAFALKYPSRVKALIYLDAAYDRADPEVPPPHMDAWQKVATTLYGGASEEAMNKSFEARRAAMANLFRADYGVRWGKALESNLREVSIVNVDGTVSPRTPGWVSAAIGQSSRSERLDVGAIRVPALLIFARGRLPADLKLIPAFWALIRKDEDDYGQYFARYVTRVRKENPRLEIKILPEARHYFFLKEASSVASWIARYR